MSEILDTSVHTPSAQVELSTYAEKAYLDYAMSVVMGRALPMLPDGLKPVQRRILYAMHRMGLTDKSKHVKSARVVGDVLGKYHAHGDSSVYEAAVRMSQDFSLRYPLIDGQGNFGDRDGSGAAAMRYTEMRLTPIADLLLGELDVGTVDFVPNYDGTLQEPSLLPARLPVLLLNGASGIAVGMATEIPSHNLREVANACERLIRNPETSLQELLTLLPGPDFPCGAQIISSPEDIFKAYSTGRGSFRTRARWTVENLARGQWQIAVTALPPDASTAKVMLEIEALTNPQVKSGKKTLTPEQTNLKALLLSLVDKISDDSDAEHPVRLVIEPKSSRVNPDELMQVLLAHTSLESNVSLNLVTIGLDGKPQQKGLIQVLQEWIAFRYTTVTRRTQHRLDAVRARLHILAGRLMVYVHLDEVIAIIRAAEDPKVELMKRYGLSEIQANDILEIRLRQLAGMEKLKLEQESSALEQEALGLELLLKDRDAMTAQILKEIKADTVKFGDERRTLIEPAEKITTAAVVAAAQEPITILVSKMGWLRARGGHKVDASTLTWKPEDEPLAVLEAHTTDTLVVLDSTGRAYNLAVSSIPSGRGDGVPWSSMLETGGSSLAQAAVLQNAKQYLLAGSGGYGFICQGADLQTRQRAGKVVMTLESGESVLPVTVLDAVTDTGEAAVANSAGKLLVFPLNQLKQMPKGRGVQLMTLNSNDRLTAVTASTHKMEKLTATQADAELLLQSAELQVFRGNRARAGAYLPTKQAAQRLAC